MHGLAEISVSTERAACGLASAMTAAECQRWDALGGVARVGSDDARFCVALVERGLAECYDCSGGYDHFVLLEAFTPRARA